jgi:hypothetical protein
MEHELTHPRPQFNHELSALLQSASIVKVFGWNGAKQDTDVISLIQQHHYNIEAYTFLNYAKLSPKNKAP